MPAQPRQRLFFFKFQKLDLFLIFLSRTEKKVIDNPSQKALILFPPPEKECQYCRNHLRHHLWQRYVVGFLYLD